MPVIDFHTHVFPDKIAAAAITDLEQKSGLTAATNGCVDGLLSSMEHAGVDCSVILPVVTSPKQFSGINRFASTVNETYGQKNTGDLPRLISFGGIHPDQEDIKEQLRSLKEMGFVGIKLHPDYQGVDFNDIRYKRIVSYATELGFIISVHAGIDIGIPNPVRCTPAMSLEVLRDTEPEHLVLAHMGGWKLWDEVEACLVGRKVYLDTSFIVSYMKPEQFRRIVSAHGADKLLFATDSPWSGQAESLQWLEQLDLKEQEREAILYQNAYRLLNGIKDK